MARASTATLLPLDRFAFVAGIHPLHFNQVTVPDIAPASTCDMPVLQYSWAHADRVGREELAQAIAAAEDMISDALGFFPAPAWIIDEKVRIARPYSPTLYSVGGMGVRGQAVSVHTSKNHIISGGVQAKSVVRAAAPIVYSDTDGDGYFETATVSSPTTITDVNEIALYYPGKSADQAYEIRPIVVSIAAGTVTITCKREQLVLETYIEGLDPVGVDGLDNALFLTTLDIYRKYNDPQTQIQFHWESGPFCACDSSDCAVCVADTQNGCLLVRDARLGIAAIHSATWDAVDNEFDTTAFAICRTPDRARLWYRSGWQNNSLARPLVDMDPRWERAITYLALTLIDRSLCACDALQAFTRYWSEDLARNTSSGAGSESNQLAMRSLENPLGTTRASLFAWNLIQRQMVGEAVLNA